MVAGAFLFSMRSCKYSASPKGWHKQTRILRKGDIKCYRKRRKLPHSSRRLNLVDKVSLTFRTQKNGVNNATVTQWRKGKHICPVQVWADLVTRLDYYPGSSYNTHVNTVWVKNHKTTITSQIKTKSLMSGTLSFGEERLRLSHKEVGTHSLWSGFSMELFLTRVYPETIMIIGWWSRNAFLRYIHIQLINLSKGISNLMVSTRSFYKIPKAEVVYYTPGQPGVQYRRLKPQQGITNNTTSSLSLPRLNFPQVRNTHATFSEMSEQETRKDGSSYFYPNRPLPIIPSFPGWNSISNFSLKFKFRWRFQPTQ